jgi:hypothetical protein
MTPHIAFGADAAHRVADEQLRADDESIHPVAHMPAGGECEGHDLIGHDTHIY